MYDPQIEGYLASLEERLKTLSKERREDELSEIRQHLEALKADFLAQGQPEKDATEAAIQRFGHAGLIGNTLSNSAEGKRRVWRATAIYAVTVAVIYLFFATANDKPTDFPSTFRSQILLALVFPMGIWIHALPSMRRLRS